ncbi:MAG: hypothetical protein GXP19_01015 [Gammaproteobacteria bacterium]|nr:hypothetical protein [Gammaproteobacteria bacterium]
MMNYSNKRRVSLLLIAVLLFASVQSVFASQITASEDHTMMGHSTVVSYVGYMQPGNNNGRCSIDSDSTVSDSAMLCSGSACTHCVICISVLPDTSVSNSYSNTAHIVNFVVTTSQSYLDLPSKDRPPRNA